MTSQWGYVGGEGGREGGGWLVVYVHTRGKVA